MLILGKMRKIIFANTNWVTVLYVQCSFKVSQAMGTKQIPKSTHFILESFIVQHVYI